MEDQVLWLVGPLVPAVGVVTDTGVFVGADLEAVDGPLEGCFPVDLVQVGLVGYPLDAASTVDVQHTSVVDQFPVAVSCPVPADHVVDAVEADVVGIVWFCDGERPRFAGFVAEVQVDEVLSGVSERPEVGGEGDAW